MIIPCSLGTIAYALAWIVPWRTTFSVRASSKLRFRVHRKDAIGRHIAKYGVHEPDLTEWIGRRLAAAKDGLFVDIGAHIGWHAIHAAQYESVEKVVAFEPDPFNADLLKKNIAYNKADKVIVNVAAVGSAPNVLLVHPELPVTSVGEFVAYAKANPGKVQYASGGVGSFQHLGGELFKLTAGVDLLHVPFKGGGPAMIDVLGGHSKAVFATTITALPHVRAGKVRALGVGSRARSPVLPDVPTIAEAGVPGYEAVNWIGIVAPAGTPPAIAAKLHEEISAVLDSAEVQKQFASEGVEPMRMSSAEFAAFMGQEMGKWERVVKEGGIKPE